MEAFGIALVVALAFVEVPPPATGEQVAQMLAELKTATQKQRLPKTSDVDAVRRLLVKMVEVDQAVRNGRHSSVEIDELCTAALKQWLGEIEWFSVSKWGAEFDNKAWLLVQHADHDVPFQEMVLSRLERLVNIDETDRSSYAYLFDRVAVNTGKKQRYGTQGRCVGPSDWQPHDTEDAARVDERRAWARIKGFTNLADYKVVMDTHCK